MSASLCMSARGDVISLAGVDHQLDTVFHTQVGPGTTQTQLRISGAHSLNVFYLTVDTRAEGVDMRVTSGKNKVAGNATVAKQAAAHTTPDCHYYAGSNGDFYITSGTATNGSSIVGTPTTAMTIDREVYRTATSHVQFSYDIYGVPRICFLDYTHGTASFNGSTVAFKAINNDAPNNAVTLYTSKYWGSSNQPGLADNCSEVTAKLVDGDHFYAGGTYRLEVTSEVGHTGDMTVPDGQFVILGRGSANDFVANLKVGDVVEFFNSTRTPDGTEIEPACVVSGYPKVLENGESVNDRDESLLTARHPRTGVGIAADGTTLIIMVVDGRTVASVGVTTHELGEIMRYAGAVEAANLDGGGSSTLYTEALGVRNHCSDGSERAVSNALFAVLSAPEDNQVASLAFYDFHPEMPHLGLYTPRVMAFNQYGLCIDPDFKDFTLSCPAELGEIIDGQTLYVTGQGMHALTASFEGATSATVPVEVAEAKDVTLTYPSVIIDNNHPYSIALYQEVGDNIVPLFPAALTWVSENPDVATVDEQGTVTAVANGTVVVNGIVGETAVAQTIVVENSDVSRSCPYLPEAVEGWEVNKTGLGDVTVAADGDLLNVGFTVTSTRGPKLTIKPKALTYGCPEGFEIAFDPAGAQIAKVVVNLLPANSPLQTAVTFDNLPLEATTLFVPVSALDPCDAGIYPLELSSIAITPDVAKNTAVTISMKVEQVYSDFGSTIDVAAEHADNLQVTVANGLATLNFDAQAIAVVDICGRTIAVGRGQSIALPAGHGIAVLIADGRAAKIAY